MQFDINESKYAASEDTFQLNVHTPHKATSEASPFCVSGQEKCGRGEELERQQWGSKAEYLLAMVGYCVGLGNVWRFPYICIRNGGGAFLIPFVTCLLVCGLPLYFMEVSMGQFQGKSTFHVFSICPLIQGVGISTNALMAIACWYYPMVLVWSFVFLTHSLSDPLPWTLCGQWWNSDLCQTTTGRSRDNSTTHVSRDNSTWEEETTHLAGDTGTDVTRATNTSISASEEFWMNNILQISDGFPDIQGLLWHTCVALVVSSLVILLGIIKGPKSMGKVVYVTATLPYFLITIMLIRNLTLPGALNGVLYYIKPDFVKLYDYRTWIEACLQVFYSLGPCWGSLHTMASYNKFKNNCLRDSVVLTFFCEGTSVFAGFTVFAMLGYMAETLQVPIETFAKSGPGLAFVVYPEAVSYLPLPQLWAVLFFITILTIGLDSCFLCFETVTTTIADLWPRFMRRHEVGMKCVFMAVLTLMALVFCTPGGFYYYTLIDWYYASITTTTIGFLECIGVGWIYGAERLRNDIALMLGKQPPYIFSILWKFITPCVLVVIFVFTLIGYKSPTLKSYKYSPEEELIGWMIALVSFIPIPVYAIYSLCIQNGGMIMRIQAACKPSKDWAPQREKLNVNEKV